MHVRATRSKRRFALYFGEMVLVMLIGMGVLSGVAALLFHAGGGSLDDTSGTVRVLIMGFNMTAPMVAWMTFRGHTSAQTIEMAGAMIAPSLLAAALATGGVLGADGALALQHVVMIPAMLGVMLLRYDEYARHSH